MKRIYFILTILLISSHVFSQSPYFKFHMDSLNLSFVDTVFRTPNDYKIRIHSYIDPLYKNRILVISIEDKKNNIITKRYDLDKKIHFETRTLKEINGETYLDGPSYWYGKKNKRIYLENYKMNYRDGKAIVKDSTGQIISKSHCNAKKRKCKTKLYYDNGNIEKKHQTIAFLRYTGKYIEYYKNGNVKVKGAYKSGRIRESSPFVSKKRKQFYENLEFYDMVWISLKEGYYSIKKGTWKYYNEDGTIQKIEKYDKEGNLTE